MASLAPRSARAEGVRRNAAGSGPTRRRPPGLQAPPPGREQPRCPPRPASLWASIECTRARSRRASAGVVAGRSPRPSQPQRLGLIEAGHCRPRPPRPAWKRLAPARRPAGRGGRRRAGHSRGGRRAPGRPPGAGTPVRDAPTVEASASRTRAWAKANVGPSSTSKRRRTPSSRWSSSCRAVRSGHRRQHVEVDVGADHGGGAQASAPAAPARAQRSSTAWRIGGRQRATSASGRQLDQKQRMATAASVQFRGPIRADDRRRGVEVERPQRDGGHARRRARPLRLAGRRPPVSPYRPGVRRPGRTTPSWPGPPGGRRR